MSAERGHSLGDARASTDELEALRREVQRLRSFEQLYDTIVGGAFACVAQLDAETGRIAEANAVLLETFGYTPETVREVDLGTLGCGEPPYTREDALRWIARSFGGPQFFEWRARARPGEPTWLEVTMMAYRWGERSRVMVILNDTSAHKHRAQQLVELEARHIALLEISADAVVLSNESGVVFANAAAARLWNVQGPRDLQGRQFVDLVAPEHHALVARRIAETRTPGAYSPPIELQIVRDDGARVDVEVASVTAMYHGHPCRQTVLRNISERKAQERALRESEARFRAMAMLTSDSMYELWLYPDDSASMSWATDWTKGLPEMIPRGRNPSEVWLALLHPDDRHVRDEWNATLRRGETDEREFRVVARDGSYRWIASMMRPVGRSDDGALRVIGAMKDIHALREAHEKERALRAELDEAREGRERTLLTKLTLGAPPRRIVRPGEERGEEGYYFGRTRAMRAARELAEIAASHDESVLLIGETGTGKGDLAQWIHDRSPAVDRPFVALNCSSLRGELLLSELFGHARGAFTTALRDRKGLVEEADGGTLFLDEIGELEPHVQVLLLKVLEEKTFRRVGETALRRSNFRLVCATNGNLWRDVEAHRFRKDLYFRINVFPIALPTLAERREDLPELVRAVLRGLDAPCVEVSDATLRLLARYHWPGNVRELRNALIRAILLARGGPVLPQHFPGVDVPPLADAAGVPVADDAAVDDGAFLAQLRELLERYGGNRSKVARALGISRTTLYRHLQKHGLARDEAES